MALSDLLKRVVLTEFRADTAQAVREVDVLIERHTRLKNAAQQSAQQQAAHFDQIVLDLTRSTQVAQKEETNWTEKKEKGKKAGEVALATYAKMGIAIGALGGVVAVAADAWNHWGDSMRLHASTAGISIEKLTEATNGLISHHELMTFAAQTHSGVLKLTQADMETMGQAAIALRARGFDLEESFKKLQDAAVKGKVGGLDDLGLSIEEGSSKAQTLRNMMKELNKVIAETGPVADQHGDSVRRLGVWWDNAKDSAKNYAAEALIAIAEPIDFMKVAQMEYEKMWNESPIGRLANRMDAMAHPEKYNPAVNTRKGMVKGIKSQQDMEVVEMDDDDMSDDVEKVRQKRKEAAKKLAEERKKHSNAVAKELTGDLITQLEAEIEAENVKQGLAEVSAMLWEGVAMSGATYAKDQLDITMLEINQQTEKWTAELYDKWNAEQGHSFLEQVLGPIENFDAYQAALQEVSRQGGNMAEEFNALAMETGIYQAAFESLTTAVGASYEALISGSEPASAAFKKMFADMLMAMGKSSAIEAIKELAYAVGSAAMYNYPAAALHLKSAALHTAVAIAAGAAAHSIGTSAQAGASAQAEKDKAAKDKADADKAAQRAGDRKGTAGGSDGGGQSVIYVYGDPFADDNPARRARTAEKAIKRVIPSFGEDG